MVRHLGGQRLGRYRTDTDCDVEVAADGDGGGFDVAITKVGEWMKYTVAAANGGAYTLQARVANRSQT